jgi:hypothetical protein
MAITKERLKELIEKEATIYTLNNEWKLTKENAPYIDNKYNELILNCHCKKCNGQKKWLAIVDIFETKKEQEEAEWKAEFCNIERTETLSLPSWEEAEKYGSEFYIKFYSSDYNLYCIEFDEFEKSIELIKQTNDFNIAKYWTLTKENYIEACRLCVKLFKGE